MITLSCVSHLTYRIICFATPVMGMFSRLQRDHLPMAMFSTFWLSRAEFAHGGLPQVRRVSRAHARNAAKGWG
jgi:hypothetical protein